MTCTIAPEWRVAIRDFTRGAVAYYGFTPKASPIRSGRGALHESRTSMEVQLVDGFIEGLRAR